FPLRSAVSAAFDSFVRFAARCPMDGWGVRLSLSPLNICLPRPIETLEARIAPAFAAVLDVTVLTAANGFVLSGENSLDYAGYSVSAAGDVNGDGFADMLVGAYGADPHGNESAGAAYVIFGKANGVVTRLDLSTL